MRSREKLVISSHSTRFSSASPPSHAAAVSGQPAGEPGVNGRCPASVKNGISDYGFSGTKFNARNVDSTKSCGVLYFASGSFQLSLAAINAR